jgi:glutamate racemase
MDHTEIGVFDSGVGGLAILREILTLLPSARIEYLADQHHVPYGPRPLLEIRRFSEGITHFLVQRGAQLIVVACNTASAAALHHLREQFPEIKFVGMEPAVKPAAATSQTHKVGVLATPTTFQGELFASVVERFAQGVNVVEQTLPGMVELIEAGNLDGPETIAIVQENIDPLVEQGIDTLVMACTHYSFIIPLLQNRYGKKVSVIDPAPAIARQTERLYLRIYKKRLHPGGTTLFSTLDPASLYSQASRLIGFSGLSLTANWEAGRLKTEARLASP